eukprot:3514348-Rhodomonas_salina.1
MPTHIDTDSIESGLMTLVVKGSASYFDNGVAGGYSLELEDLITIHIMETGVSTYESVKGMLAEQRAFTLLKDASDHRVHITPSSDLGLICNFAPGRPTRTDWFPTSCIIRRDVDKRQYPGRGGSPSTAMELDPDNTDGAAQFMQTIFGASDYAETLGRNFSQVIDNKYKLNGRFQRAYWINPGYEWAPQQTVGVERFLLSQRLIMVALVRLDEAGGATRRMLIDSETQADKRRAEEGQYGEGISLQDMSFAVSADMLVAMSLNVERTRVTTWSLSMLLTDEQACMRSHELRSAIGAVFAAHLTKAASPAEHIVISSARVDRGSVDCLAGRRALEWYSGASGTFETAVVFQDPMATVNIGVLNRMDGVIEVVAVKSYSNVVVDNSFVPGAAAGAGAADSGGKSSQTLLITALCASLFGMLLACGLSYVWVRAGKSMREVEVPALVPLYKRAGDSESGSETQSGPGKHTPLTPMWARGVMWNASEKEMKASFDGSFKSAASGSVKRAQTGGFDGVEREKVKLHFKSEILFSLSPDRSYADDDLHLGRSAADWNNRRFSASWGPESSAQMAAARHAHGNSNSNSSAQPAYNPMAARSAMLGGAATMSNLRDLEAAREGRGPLRGGSFRARGDAQDDAVRTRRPDSHRSRSRSSRGSRSRTPRRSRSPQRSEAGSRRSARRVEPAYEEEEVQ